MRCSPVLLSAHRCCSAAVLALAVISLSGGVQASPQEQSVRFKDVTVEAGLLYMHGYQEGATTSARQIAGGVAAGDFDLDGWTDLYVVRGDIGANLLFRNRGDGTFEEVAARAGLDIDGSLSSGPAFADWDGDSWPDLIVGGIEDTPPRLFRNRGDGTFEEITEKSGVRALQNTFSAAFGDYDRDGDLDLFLTHWTMQSPLNTVHLWNNAGDGIFRPVPDLEAGLDNYLDNDFSFTPNFADVNQDSWPDLLISADFSSSQIYLNRGDGSFLRTTSSVITDENGMGSAVADYDNDGDLDWFVSSIWDFEEFDGGWGVTGNRLYRNQGDGTFEDVTTPAGVRQGFWGWGSCFADFNNDGHLDLFHVNGFKPPSTRGDEPDPSGRGAIFLDDPSRLFMSDGQGAFQERSAEAGLDDRGQGRGVVCFDYDRDGDIDIFVANNSGPSTLYQNTSSNQNHFLALQLRSPKPGQTPVGSRIWLKADGLTQMRELQAGSNFVSQQPQEIHFGLGRTKDLDELRIQWLDGGSETYREVLADQLAILGGAEPPQLLAHRKLIFPYVPLRGPGSASFRLSNDYLSAAGAEVEFFDASGKPLAVTLGGLGSSFSFILQQGFLEAGESKELTAWATGPASFGMAVLRTDYPLRCVLTLQQGSRIQQLQPASPLRSARFGLLSGFGLRAGLALANPGDSPIWVRLILLDGNGETIQSARPPQLNPLPPRGQFKGRLSELGFGLRRMPAKAGWSVRAVLSKGESFGLMGFIEHQGRITWIPAETDEQGLTAENAERER